MKLKDLIHATAMHTRIKVHAWYKEHVLLIADCRIDEAKEVIDEISQEKEIDFISIAKDGKGVSLNVTICE